MTISLRSDRTSRHATVASTADIRPVGRLLVDAVRNLRGPLPADQTELFIDAVVEAGALHRVGPAIYRRVVNADNAPAGWASELAKVRAAQLFRHMRASADLAPIADTFDRKGIRWVLAKGPAAADLIWPSPDMREYVDIDLFVHPADFAEALAALESLGCALVDRNWPEIRKRKRAELALTAPAGTPIDLHWDMAVPPSLRSAFSTDMIGMLSRRRHTVLGSGVAVFTFDPVDTVLHLAFHAAQAGAARLMWLGDLFYAVRTDGFDIGELMSRAGRARTEVPVTVVLDRADRVLGLPSEIAAGLGECRRRPAARVIRWRDGRVPLPALPGDRNRAADIVSGVRRGTSASALAMFRFLLETRRIDRRVRRHGPDAELLDLEVSDSMARADYLSLVAERAC
ncbi:MAG: hypothetical protein EPN48_08985 [Microbacteriaceae bacterium]|nr:MAG: hypothetical protein EPN48_08985 [Microbacteriaceae bacterium]